MIVIKYVNVIAKINQLLNQHEKKMKETVEKLFWSTNI